MSPPSLYKTNFIYGKHRGPALSVSSPAKAHALASSLNGGLTPVLTVSRWDRLLIFGACNLAAAICFVLCFVLFSILWPVPRKFAILYVYPCEDVSLPSILVHAQQTASSALSRYGHCDRTA